MSSGSQNYAGPIFDVTILRSKSTGQMIYLEAKKDLVDILLSFLVLPVGTIMRVLNAQGVKERKFGAIDNIYQSMEKLQDSILNVQSTLLTEPRPELGPIPGYNVLNPVRASPKTFYLCMQCNLLSENSYVCSACRPDTNKSVRPRAHLPSAYPQEGYVKEGVTYIVGNNLEIMPTSTINTMDVLSKMKVMNFSDLLSIDKKICREDVGSEYTCGGDVGFRNPSLGYFWCGTRVKARLPEISNLCLLR